MHRGRTPNLLSWLGFGAAGAALMYVLDPQGGPRRRAGLRDRLVHWSKKAAAGAEAAGRDMRNRTMGFTAESRSLVRCGEPVGDDVLAERVRAELGRVVSHPGSLAVDVRDGRVTLSGLVLEREVGALLRRVRRISGVREVESRLETRRTADRVSGLQGGVPRHVRPDIWQTHWSPTTRVLAGSAGAALLGVGRRMRPLRIAGWLAGAGLLGRAVSNLPLRRLLGLGASRRAVELWKTINVAAPVDRVYAFWRSYTSFPRFMAHVHDVRDLGNRRSRWVVAGPGATPVEYDAEITRDVPGELLAWKTVPGSVVAHEGSIRFDPNPDGSTRVHIRMSYNPPAGAAGHVLATLLGSDPKSRMDADLARMRTLLETGEPPRDAARPIR